MTYFSSFLSLNGKLKRKKTKHPEIKLFMLFSTMSWNPANFILGKKNSIILMVSSGIIENTL